MGSKRYKVVDTFNGWESDRTHATIEEAEKELEKEREGFFACLVNQNSQFCKKVIPAELTWHHTSTGWTWE